MKIFHLILCFILIVVILVCIKVWYEDRVTPMNDTYDDEITNSTTESYEECNHEALMDHSPFIILQNTTLAYNILSFKYMLVDGKICVLTNKSLDNVTESEVTVNKFLDCPDKKLTYEPEEFIILLNGSALLYEDVLDPGTYEIVGDKLKICSDDDDYDGSLIEVNGDSVSKVLIVIGKVGTVISVIALCLHLAVFILVPTMRNLPGYNLTSFSVALLMAYSVVIFGQIPSVLGTACVVSAALQQYFFLSAFFWMNVMAYDVWRSLRLATHNLIAPSGKIKKRFIMYMAYAWHFPLWFTIAAVITDYSEGISDYYKPFFGRDDYCWFTNYDSKAIFFAIPSFSLFGVNIIMFISCAFMIINNTMSECNSQQRDARKNFMLYARLGLIMGITWLIGIVGVIVKKQALWFVFDILNSLQGLFVFLFFSCSSKNWFHLTRQMAKKKHSMDNSKSSSSKFYSSTNELP